MARRLIGATLLLLISLSANAFTTNSRRATARLMEVVVSKPSSSQSASSSSSSSSSAPISIARSGSIITSTQLQERRWNFNEGQSPWGLKRNAEIWNGRVAQMAFVGVVLQELIQGKGVIQGLQEGDPVNLACAGLFAFVVIGLTGFLASKGDDDYVTRYLEENNLKR